MDVFLLRPAALALDPADPNGHPFAFLSAEGRQIVRALGHRVHTVEGQSFDRIVASPWPAAVQTAELFADRVDFVGVVEVSSALQPGVPPAIAAPWLLAPGASVLVVADEPSLSNLGAFLIGRPTFPPLMKGQLSVIHERKPAWCLRPGELARSLLLVA